jgi:hypothetical protein
MYQRRLTSFYVTSHDQKKKRCRSMCSSRYQCPLVHRVCFGTYRIDSMSEASAATPPPARCGDFFSLKRWTGRKNAMPVLPQFLPPPSSPLPLPPLSRRRNTTSKTNNGRTNGANDRNSPEGGANERGKSQGLREVRGWTKSSEPSEVSVVVPPKRRRRCARGVVVVGIVALVVAVSATSNTARRSRPPSSFRTVHPLAILPKVRIEFECRSPVGQRRVYRCHNIVRRLDGHVG